MSTLTVAMQHCKTSKFPVGPTDHHTFDHHLALCFTESTGLFSSSTILTPAPISVIFRQHDPLLLSRLRAKMGARIGQAVFFIVVGVSIAVLFFLFGLANRIFLSCAKQKELENHEMRTMTRDRQAAIREIDARYREAREAREQEARDGEARDKEARDKEARDREDRDRANGHMV